MGHEYGWSKEDIYYHTYFDEFFLLLQQIKRRQNTEYKMQLAIASNPHVKNPKELWDILSIEERAHTKPVTPQFDAAGFERLKQRLNENPRFLVK